MRNSVLDFRNLPGASPVLGKLIASSLLLGGLGTLGVAISTQPSTALPNQQTTTVAQANNVNQRLVGLWQTRPSRPGEPPLKLVFGPNSKLYIVLPAPSGKAQALELNYRINPGTRPMQLDIIASNNQTAQTIFEFTQDQKLRLQLQNLAANKPRPTGFTSATVLEKVSNATTLPANAQVVRPGSPNFQAPQR